MQKKSNAKLTFLNLDSYGQTGTLAELFNIKAFVLGAVLLVLTRGVKRTKNLHPIIFIAFSAAIGIVFSFGGA